MNVPGSVLTNLDGSTRHEMRGTVGTGAATYTYPQEMEALILKNLSANTLTYVAGDESGSVAAGAEETVETRFSSITLTGGAANTEFIARALGHTTKEINDKIMLTPEGGIAVKMINKTGSDSVKGTVIAPAVLVEAGDAQDKLSGWVFEGVTPGTVLYYGVAVDGDSKTVSVYSDSAGTAKVAEGTSSSTDYPVTITLAEENDSGISGSVVVATGVASDDTISANTLTFPPDNAFIAAAADGSMAFGIVYEDDIADGDECWVVINGVADVLMKDSSTVMQGYWVRASASVAGRADTASSIASDAVHMKQIGHAIEDKAGGTDQLVRCVVHFN